MKKLINRPDAVVEEMVEGLILAFPGLARLPGQTVLVRDDAAANRCRQVALISGGGSGHEPAHAGFVGRGMLSAAVAGDVFTSPGVDAVLAAIRAVAGDAGAILIVKNYTGDRLNFGLAAELARIEGIAVEVVIVADDVALAGTDAAEFAGRRGLAGTIFVHKVAGAAAEAGLSLAEVAAEARDAAEAIGTMGVALSACIVPAAGTPGFTLGDREVELGLGIHGEPGVRREPIASADDLVDRLIDAILGQTPAIAPAGRAALLVNNLGGTPIMELAIVARCAIETLEARGIAVARAYVGTFLSALEMAGVSLSVLAVDDDRLARLDAPTDAPAWPNASDRPRRRPAEVARGLAGPSPDPGPRPGPPKTVAGQTLARVVQAVARSLTEAAPALTELDRQVGDGDLGLSLARGVAAAVEALPGLPLDDQAENLHRLGPILQRAMGGTSGPLYAILLVRAAARLRSSDPADPRAWAEAFRAGIAGVGDLGGAAPGDRTMLDALVPAAEALEHALEAGRSPDEAIRAAAEAAEAGAKATARLRPRRGRSSYLGDRALGHLDPGASAVAIWLGAIADALGQSAGPGHGN